MTFVNGATTRTPKRASRTTSDATPLAAKTRVSACACACDASCFTLASASARGLLPCAGPAAQLFALLSRASAAPNARRLAALRGADCCVSRKRRDRGEAL
eukprot:6176575-Pleurochrysis_carterae.AAC.2